MYAYRHQGYVILTMAEPYGEAFARMLCFVCNGCWLKYAFGCWSVRRCEHDKKACVSLMTRPPTYGKNAKLCVCVWLAGTYLNYTVGKSPPTCVGQSAPPPPSLILTATTEVLAIACVGTKQEAANSKTLPVSGGEYVTVSLDIDMDSITSSNFLDVRDKVVLAVARAAAVHPLRVSVTSNEGANRRLLQLSLVLRILAASSEDARAVQDAVLKADLAAELRALGLDVKVSLICART
jgi:hypothetical protein